ncbi:MAG: histidine kinase dimerization/phospho-acceptor domain-containing protein, partial [Mucilaginibacter sp.]
MKAQLPFFNFSLRKVLALEPDSFKKAKIKIILTILVFSVVKLLIALPVAIEHEQYRQIFRSTIIIVLFLVLIKLMLSRPSIVTTISHFMIVSGIVVIWTNLFLYVNHINIFTIQLIFMITLSSYYLIGGKKAAVYTMLSMASIVVFILTRDTLWGHFKLASQELPSPGVDIIIMLNFITFLLIHYLYYRAFRENLAEKELLNEQLEINVREAKALAESRSVFLSTMSHELRTPLNGVIGMTNLIKDTALPEQKDYLNVLEFSATNLLSVVNDILDYNKIELDKIELEAVPVSLPALLQQICTGLGIKAAEKALAWKLEVDSKLKDRLVVTDPTRLTQIIYNLAGNAIKFTSEGMVGVSLNVLTETEGTIRIRFTITDTGIGIEDDRQEAIFD